MTQKKQILSFSKDLPQTFHLSKKSVFFPFHRIFIRKGGTYLKNFKNWNLKKMESLHVKAKLKQEDHDGIKIKNFI